MDISELKISLPIFEGPLDLLLYLIKKDDVDIYDINISQVLDQYLSYLEMMKDLDIDYAGEFIMMASELAHIKSRMLLTQDVEETDEGPDPRADLIARLMQYQRFKLAAEALQKRTLLHRDVFKRPELENPQAVVDGDLGLDETQWMAVEPFNLIKAFHEILRRVPHQAMHEVNVERASVTERIYEILETLPTGSSVSFESLFETDATRLKLIVTFLALLEMTRLKMINIQQMEGYGEIWVTKKMDTTQEATKELRDDYH